MPDLSDTLLSCRIGTAKNFTLLLLLYLTQANGREIPRNPYALRLLREHAPVDIFLVMLGTNDLLQGAAAKEAAARMEAFLNQLLPHFKNILLIAPPPMKRGAWVPTDELVAESIHLAEEFKLLAKNLNIPFVDTRNWNIELTFDGVHFTEAGHHTFADHLIKLSQVRTAGGVVMPEMTTHCYKKGCHPERSHRR